jgi:Putative porin
MKGLLALTLAFTSTAAAALSARAQEPPPVYQPEHKYSFTFKVDGLLREEWTRDIFVTTTQFRDEDRFRFRVRPAIEVGLDKLVLGVGGDFNYSSDRNFDEKAPPLLLRDNYDSRDARLDLAYASLKPASWLQVQGGRFEMPVAFTEMIWDKDLRPQGGALTLEMRDHGALARLAVTGLYARGSHVFPDETNMFVGSVEASFKLGEKGRLQLIPSYLEFTNTDSLAPFIRRQNTRVIGLIVNDYRVIDGVARLRYDGKVPLQLIADLSSNTAVDDFGRGVWLAAVLGSLQGARARLDYTYAKVDKDATLAAYGTDDFFWVTGWEGHRGELGVRVVEHWTVHGIGQVQRFKDSPRPEERDHWVKRFRVELRVDY